MSILSQQTVLDFLKESTRPVKYNKFGTVQYIIADAEQEVVTITSSGEETRNTAQIGDYIVTNPDGEKYVIKPTKFESRYKKVDDTTAECTGSCWAAKWEGEYFEFTASWGQAMPCFDGDMLASPDPEFSEVYRIGRKEFENTYKLAE